MCMADEVPKKVIFDNYDTIVSKIEAPLPDLRIYQFTLVGKQINFLAGQYVSLIVPGSTPAPFSIASSPEVHTMIELGIEITGGPHTSKIKELKEGDHATLRGPFGNFVLQGEKKVAFLAGGVGITPFICMLRWITETNQQIDATLFYSCKGRLNFLWLEELEEMTRKYPNVHLVATCTRETPEGWKHKLGRINAQMIKEALPDYSEYTFYSCGPPVLIEAMFNTLKEMGVPEEKLKREKW